MKKVVLIVLIALGTGLTCFADTWSDMLRAYKMDLSTLARGNGYQFFRSEAGGIGIIGVGYSSGDTINISVSECLNSGCVEARVSTGSKLAYGGGIVGYCSKKNFTVDGCVNTYRRIVGSAPSGSRAGGIFGVFNLPSDENAIICKNCVTVGALYGYNKNALADNVQNATEAAASEAAERLRAKIAG